MGEIKLENKLIEHLVKLGYEQVDITNEEQLIVNLRIQLEKLNNYQFTDQEFSYILTKLRQGNIFQKAVYLRGLETIKSESEGKLKEIIFLQKKEWCKNTFQVTHQYKAKGKYNQRYDVTLLINGLPLVQIELKRPETNVNETIGQIQRYKEETMDRSLFAFVQLFVVSNGQSTMYMANNRKVNSSFMFTWGNFQNKAIHYLMDFANDFLSPCSLGKFIARYMILSDDGDTDTQVMMAMRSYQVHAVEKILEKIEGNVHNGYIWHTTGSGKTLTSFKACELISERDDVEKVLFVVDRQDLDRQTVEEYKKFQNPGSSEICQLESTRDLIKKVNNNESKIIVTTIQKLDKAIGKGKLTNEKNIVLIFDECHRSQLGDQHQRIEKFFNHPFKFGFTGTPILKDNHSSREGIYQTTQDVFGEALHKYLINDAIDDGNVLGFKVDYKAVFKLPKEIEEKDVENIDKAEALSASKYIKTVGDDILNTFSKFTRNQEFNAMLATDGIPKAYRYFQYFSGQEVTDMKGSNKIGSVKLEKEHNLKIACVFSFTDNEKQGEGGMTNRKRMEEIIEHYNYMLKDSSNPPNFSLDTYPQYKRDVATRMKKKEIDLLIVSDMFLTGFDVKTLNTLYFDKEQKYHNLIQSLSRTNRVFGKRKDYGNIICYRPILEKNINDAIKLFSNGDAETNVLKIEYHEQLLLLQEAIDALLENYPTIASVKELNGETEKKKFIKTMVEVNKNLNAIQTYREFEETDIKDVTRHEIGEFNAQVMEIRDELIHSKEDKDSILNDIDFGIELLQRITIDYDYIIELLEDSLFDYDEKMTEQEIKDYKEKVYKEISQKPQLKSKAELIKNFLENYFNHLHPIREQFNEFLDYEKNQKIIEFGSENGFDVEVLKELISEYHFAGTIDSHEYRQLVRNLTSTLEGKGLREKRMMQGVINKFVVSLDKEN